jgi:hypothetical protein
VAHTSSYPIFTGDTFPGRKSLWCGAEYSPFYPLPRPRMNRALYPLLHKSSRIFAIIRIFCVEENIKCRSKCEKTVINTTKYLLDSVGGKLVTTTCFGHQVAVVRLYTLKWILSTMCKYKHLDVEISDTLILFVLQIATILCLIHSVGLDVCS